MCGILGTDIWIITDRCPLTSTGIHRTHPVNPAAWYLCPRTIPSHLMEADLGNSSCPNRIQKSGGVLVVVCCWNNWHKDVGFSLAYHLLFSFLCWWKSITMLKGPGKETHIRRNWERPVVNIHRDRWPYPPTFVEPSPTNICEISRKISHQSFCVTTVKWPCTKEWWLRGPG